MTCCKRHIILSLLCALHTITCFAQTANSNDSVNRLADNFVKTSLMVAAPGDEIYSLWGHACFRMQCPTYQLDYCFSYVNEPVSSNLWRFLKNDLKMAMLAIPTQEYLQSYADHHRGVIEYPMNLPPAVKQQLWKILDQHLSEGMLNWDYAHHGCALSCVQILHQALDTIPIVYAPFSEEFQHNTIRELTYNYALHGWNSFVLMTLEGGDVDKQYPPEDKLLVPTDLVNAWSQAQVAGRQLLDNGIQLLPDTPRKPFPVSPLIVVLFLLFLSVLNLFLHISWIDWLSLALQTVTGIAVTYFALFSTLPALGWNWLILPFNPLPALFWHWRKYWANPYAVLLCLWCIAMLLLPHRLVSAEHILWVISFILILLKPAIQKHIIQHAKNNQTADTVNEQTD